MMEEKYYICVTPFFPSPVRWQGAYVLDQVKAIKRNSEYKVIVFKTNTLFFKENDYEIDGVEVHTIRPFLMPSYFLNGLTEKIVGWLFVRKLKSLRIDTNNVAFVHCHTSSHSAFGFGVKKINPKTKVLLQFHDLDPYTLRNGKWADKKWNVRYRAKKSLSAFNNADLLISISSPVQENLMAFPKAREAETFPSYLERLRFLEDFPSVKPRNTYILYNGVDTSLFNIKGRESISHNCFRIGCIGNFQELKDHISLIKGFEILIMKGYTDMRLSLLGTGSTRLYCEEYLRNHGLWDYVEWPNEVNHNQLPYYYRTLDIFVLPSVYEGFGCVYTEAFACGVPFICCYNQGAAELISPEQKDWWLVDPHSPEQIANRIESYYLDKQRQVLCHPFDIDTLIKDFLVFLCTLK